VSGSGQTRIELCGRLSVELAGRRIEAALPGRQGRLLFAYLALNRDRPAGRDELIELLWPRRTPQDPDEALSSLLSRLRRALSAPLLEGRTELVLRLPADAWIDLEAARRAVERGERAVARADWSAACDAGTAALEVTQREFFAREDHPWIEHCRREVEEQRLRALECIAAAGIHIGGAELAAGERAAGTLVEAAPFRETGHRLLMETLAARGNVAEALRVFDRLRVLLREELGVAPGPAVMELHQQLLRHEPRGPGAGARLEDTVPVVPSREERKVVTMLVAELAADPIRGDATDPEHARAAVERCLARLRAELERFGGAVQPFSGPALVAAFGAPRTHEDDAARAVAAALRVSDLVAETETPSGRALVARAGLATGETIVTLGRGKGEPAGAVSGDVVTSAFRLQAAAPDGGVVVDEPTYRAARARVAFDRLAPLTIEGRRETIPLWRAVSMYPEPAAPAPKIGRTRLIGRERELSFLDDAYRAVIEERRPRLVLVVGDAGIGKSRLVDEFGSVTTTRTVPPSVFRGRCLPYGVGVTFWALREILWAVAGIALDDRGETARDKLRRLALRLPEGANAERALFALAIGSGIALPGNPLDGTSPEAVAEELAMAWPLLLSTLAAEHPTVLVVEDLHWAEQSLLDMLERMFSRSSGRLLIIATARPELAGADAGWSPRLTGTQIGLEPLTPARSRVLVDALLPDADAHVREQVTTVVEGNPFFAEEIAGHLRDGGEPGMIPSTVRAVLAARIDALSEAERRTIQDAAVAGRTFWVTTLESMRDDPSIRSSLRSMEQKGLVVTRPASSLPAEMELAFRHALIREVAYASIPHARRCRAHADVAAWLEELAGDRRGEFVDLLAHHHEAAADPAYADLAWSGDTQQRDEVRRKAVAALVEAGHAARQRFQTDQALAYAGRTLTLARDDAERLAALELRASTLHAAVRADEALDNYVEALELARRIGATDTAARLRADATLLCARYQGAFARDDWTARAVGLVQEGLDEVGEDSLGFETAALLIGRAVSMRWPGARPADTSSARRDARRAIEIAHSLHSPYLLAAGLHALYKVAIAQGLGECPELAERMVEAADQIQDRVEAHETVVIASTCFYWAGRFDRAREIADRAIAEAVGLSPHRRLHATAVQAACLAAAGRMPDLLAATVEVADLVREEGARTCPYGALALSRQALARFEAGDTDAAEATFELLLEAAPRRRAAAYLYRAAEALRPFVGIDAIRNLMERLEGLSPLDAADETSRLRWELQLAALGAEGPPSELVARARGLAKRARAPFLGWIAEWAEAVALARGGAHEKAAARARAAAAALDAYGEPYAAMRLLVDLLPFLDDQSRHGLAEETAKRLEQMGAVGSAAEARGLL
jgi:DNA-binding SARP family transcriptional activator/tetratricopeptide (TPR) repeat protein